jgi:hypothetical protein
MPGQLTNVVPGGSARAASLALPEAATKLLD